VKGKNEISKTETNLLPVGFTPIAMQDLQIPFILLGQGQSQAVFEKLISPGDIYESVTHTTLGNTDKAIEIIPIGFFKLWICYDGSDFIGHEEYSESDNALPDLVELEGNIKKKRSFNYYCLLTSDIKKGEAFPYIVSFKGASLRRAGRGMASMIHKNMENGINPYDMTFELSSKQKSFQSNNYFFMSAKLGRKVTKDEMAQVEKWREILTKSV
jgi:hypothetical protein